MNRADFQTLALIRLQDARTLLANGRYEGAYYLAGYAVECALKACFAKRTVQFEFPPRPEVVRDVYSHNLDALLKQADLKELLRLAGQADPVLGSYWGVSKDWSEQSRYDRPTQADAEQLVQAIADPIHGVMRWLQQHW